MAYTLFMPADQRIQIAEDGVAEVPMTDARAALTPFIREVSWGGRAGAFTERGKRVAMVVPPERYEQAESDRRKAAAFDAALAELPPGERPQKFLELMVKKLAELDDV